MGGALDKDIYIYIYIYIHSICLLQVNRHLGLFESFDVCVEDAECPPRNPRSAVSYIPITSQTLLAAVLDQTDRRAKLGLNHMLYANCIVKHFHVPKPP